MIRYFKMLITCSLCTEILKEGKKQHLGFIGQIAVEIFVVKIQECGLVR